MSDLHERAVQIVKTKGLIYRDEGFTLASGERHHWYMDGKKALAEGDDLRTACEAIHELTVQEGIDYDAVGGLTLGADCFAHAIALLHNKKWFVVRKAAKDHGKAQQIEGAELNESTRVLLVDDVVSTGGSILESLHIVQAVGAPIVLAVTFVDRGDIAKAKFDELNVRYKPLMTYHDLEIPPVLGR